MKLIFRDDCISKETELAILKHVHEQFLNHHRTHTLSLICNGLERNIPLIDYINSTTNWNLCIHGWDYVNYSLLSKTQIADDLDKCILKIEELFGTVPETWYLPWNGWTKESGFDLVPRVADIAIYHGVDVDIDCDHISHAVEVLESHRNLVTNTVYFHSWERADLELLPNLFFLTRKI